MDKNILIKIEQNLKRIADSLEKNKSESSACKINDKSNAFIWEADKNLLGPRLNGKVILITGAGGSKGSEICRQIYNLNPAKLILFDMNESSLYSINKNY